jgi:hypothetical protein
MHFPRLFLSHLGSPIFGDNIYMRRLMAVDNLPTPVEPGQVDKGSRYEPLQFLQSVGIRTLAELKPQPPMFLHVYQTLLPFWGDNKTKRRVTELRLQMPPPGKSGIIYSNFIFKICRTFLGHGRFAQLSTSSHPTL